MELPARISLGPSLFIYFHDDGNILTTLEADITRPLAPAVDLLGKIFYRGYSDEIMEYFSYSYWVLAQAGLRWTQSFSNITLPVEVRSGFHLLSLQDEVNKFLGFNIDLKPAYTFGRVHKIELNITGHINTELYYLYYLGLQYGF